MKIGNSVHPIASNLDLLPFAEKMIYLTSMMMCVNFPNGTFLKRKYPSLKWGLLSGDSQL